MARTRAEEAKSVAAHLMLPPPDLFAVPEGELADPARAPEIVARLAKLLAEFKPDGVFVPFFFDQHPDHRYANHLLARALPESGLELAKVTVYAFETWAFVPPALVIDVTDVLAEKKRLVSLYRSQLALTPYLDLVDQLARPRAALAGPRSQAAEFFLPMAAAEYIARESALDLTSPQSLALNVNVTPLAP
jgi:LmbE family N-acetylglucosaminyl deacetylase